MTQQHIDSIASHLRALNIPAWLLYNFRDTNPIAMRVLGVPPDAHQSRRWAYIISADGVTRALTHRIESAMQEHLPAQVQYEYSSHDEFRQGLASLLQGYSAVAMEYSPNCEIPVIAKVDAGTVELVRSYGVEVIPSGELIAYLEAQLSQEQIASCARAGAACRQVVMEAFGYIRDAVNAGSTITEYDVREFILEQFRNRNLITNHPPIVGVNANSANPHYEPTAEQSSEIRKDDFVLIDLWAGENREGSVYGDITWTGFVGNEVPERYTKVFNIVRDARDAAFTLVFDRFAQGQPVTGAELDDAARNVIVEAGYGEYFIHRTGHSITTELHGAGANLDNYETHDTRRIIPGSSFSIEPGIYLTGDFGVRSELDVLIDLQGNVTATSQPVQREIVAVLHPLPSA